MFSGLALSCALSTEISLLNSTATTRPTGTPDFSPASHLSESANGCWITPTIAGGGSTVGAAGEGARGVEGGASGPPTCTVKRIGSPGANDATGVDPMPTFVKTTC